jgi:signal transduction histidine kinase
LTSSSRVWWSWTRWSLARQLPALTAAIIALVMGLSLTLTYRALVQARSEALRARLQGLLAPLVESSTQTARQRISLLSQAARDSAIHRALLDSGMREHETTDGAVLHALASVRLPADSMLPIELWRADGRRIAHLGEDVRGDSVALLRPELRTLRGTEQHDAPGVGGGPDSVTLGALYPSGGHVYYWAVAPVIREGRKIGYIAQHRRVNGNPRTASLVRGVTGEQFTLYLRNATDNFWSSIDGKPASAPVGRDTIRDGFLARRADVEPQIGMEGRVPTGPYVIVLEAPARSLVIAPRAAIRRIALVSFLLLVGGVGAAWALSRRITRPLVELTTAAEAIAQGEYTRRVKTEGGTPDEVRRLGASFNRMASEIEASQSELASQVEEALAVSEELEQTNTQLLEASTAADEARDAALHANRAKSDFLAVMSHELRTPLNAIGGYVEILRLGIYGEVNEAQQDALTRITRSQQTLLSLINDVLNFAKLEAGEVRYSIIDVPLTPALHQLEEVIAPQLSDRKLTYSVHPPDRSVTVRADADKLQQILINLLSNAIKYTPEGGTIDVRTEVLPGSVMLHVQDTGIGIAPDRVEKIFDPFIQVGRALNRPHEGVGLGLSISRDLARGMGGALSVVSTLGAGSTFTLSLQREERQALAG